MKKYIILHITPHLGGGVGRVLLNYCTKVGNDSAFSHEVACLDYANEKALHMAHKAGLRLIDRLADNPQQLIAKIDAADIVLIHWWNHPLLFDFIVRTELPPCRMAMWSHISGFHPPYVFTEKIFRYPDLFVFTTPVSFGTKTVQNLSDKIKKKLRVVWSTGGVEHVQKVKPKTHNNFYVGYIGTVDYCKMHSEFLDICSQIDIPDIRFIVCGGPREKEIRLEAERLGIDGRFKFTGMVNDITEYLSLFDVFGYPLSPYHYGTCDQVLAESMACGIVPVVFSNGMENQMVKDGVTGIVVNSKEAYCNAIKNLFVDKDLRSYLSKNAKEYALKAFSLEVLNKEWEKVVEELLIIPKTQKKWEIGKSNEIIAAKDVFIESLGEHGQEFISFCQAQSDLEKKKSIKKIKDLAILPIWRVATRGTAHHYHAFFPDDKHLTIWSKLMSEGSMFNEKETSCRTLRKNLAATMLQSKRSFASSGTGSVLLISPHRLPGLKVSRGSLPVSLLHLASALRQAGHTPSILDLSVMSIPDCVEPDGHYSFSICEAIKKTKPVLIGINCFSSMHFPLIRKLAAGIRAMAPDVNICLGGAHPTFYCREILENCPEFDFVVIGEGEEQVVALTDTIVSGNFDRLENIQALAYRSLKEKIVIVNSRKTFLASLDVLPFPAYDMINFTDYYADHSNWYNPKRKEIKLSIPIFTTRSCPFNCSFCSAHSIMGKKVRRRNPKIVVDEIEMLARDCGQNYFSFTDDNVNLDKEHFIAICNGIHKKELDVQLCIAQGLYLNAVDNELIRAFVNAGGITVSVPIESGSSFIRNKIIGKNLSDEKIYDAVNIFKKYDLFTVGLFIMGFAEDTKSTLNDTLSMINKLCLDVNGVSTLIPFPGTRVYQQAKEKNLMLFNDTDIWNGETFFDPQNRREFFIKPCDMDLEELWCFRKLFDSLYLTSDRAKSLNTCLQ